MTSIARDLAEVLQAVRRPGDFFVAGKQEMYLPRLEVEGVGPLALPLLARQAKALIAAPSGRRMDTAARR